MTGTTINSEGFPLALLKREGGCLRYGDGTPVKCEDRKPSTTRWIELRYSPSDEVDKDVYDKICEVLDDYINDEKKKFDADLLDNVIKAIANSYMPDRGD